MQVRFTYLRLDGRLDGYYNKSWIFPDISPKVDTFKN